MVVTIGAGSKTSYVMVSHSRANWYYPSWTERMGHNFSCPDVETIMEVDGVRIKAHEVYQEEDPSYEDYRGLCTRTKTSNYYFICKFDDFVETQLKFYYPGRTSVDVFGRKTVVEDKLGYGPYRVLISGYMEDVYRNGVPLHCEFISTDRDPEPFAPYVSLSDDIEKQYYVKAGLIKVFK